MILTWPLFGFALILLHLPVVVISTAAGLEGHDLYCAACRTEPEKEYVMRSLADPSDLASANTGRGGCINCHSGEGLLGHSVSLRQTAYDLAAYLSGMYAKSS